MKGTRQEQGRGVFDFLTSSKRKQARAVLANRANKKAILDVQGRERIASRTPLVTAVLAVPREGRKWQFAEAFPVLTSDISAGGICVLHHEPLQGDYLLQLGDEVGNSYVLFTVQHTQELGYGYWRIGLEGEDVVHASRSQERALAERAEVFEEYARQQRGDLNDE